MAPLPPSTPIEKLPNLGPVSARWLAESGITTLAQLQRTGAITAFALVRQSQGKASLNLLYALHATLTGRTWKEIPAREKEKLKSALARFVGEMEEG